MTNVFTGSVSGDQPPGRYRRNPLEERFGRTRPVDRHSTRMCELTVNLARLLQQMNDQPDQHTGDRGQVIDHVNPDSRRRAAHTAASKHAHVQASIQKNQRCT